MYRYKNKHKFDNAPISKNKTHHAHIMYHPKKSIGKKKKKDKIKKGTIYTGKNDISMLPLMNVVRKKSQHPDKIYLILSTITHRQKFFFYFYLNDGPSPSFFSPSLSQYIMYNEVFSHCNFWSETTVRLSWWASKTVSKAHERWRSSVFRGPPIFQFKVFNTFR